MNPKYIALIPILSGLSVMGQPAHAQQTPELDLTMEVIEEGELPDGFINRIALPPPEFFNSDSNNFDLSDNSSTDVVVEDSADEVEIVEQTITDTIRETISIDGTGSITGGDNAGGIVNLPDGVNDIINDTLPLDDSLEETLDGVTGVADGVVDAIDNIVDGSTDTVDDIVDNISDDIGNTVDDTTDTVDDTLNDVTGSAAGVVDSTTDLVDGATDTAALTDSLETIDSSIDDVVEDTGIVDDFDDVLTDPETETIFEVEDTLAPLVEDVTDAIPGI